MGFVFCPLSECSKTGGYVRYRHYFRAVKEIASHPNWSKL